ncbi:GIY-YIG nuclease family protein [Micromonospora sp. WMMD754]|uniref:GIY-YIG nuclease family protein n=1 Tax=Micromonospora sp. WMMD754 TaxID=3404114 RepID=UPI003BF5AD90
MDQVTYRCSLTRKDERECLQPVPPDAPMRLCMQHLQEAWLYITDQIKVRSQVNAIAAKAAYEARTSDASVVYYVRIRDHVKIGTTVNLRARMNSLDPDEVLATEPGGVDLERKRHRQFAHLRARRKEYFEAAPELMAHIDAIKRAA